MRTEFDKELEQLQLDVMKMGHLVEVAIDSCIESFKTQDKSLAKEIISSDRMINDMERTIEARAFNLILRQQPIATDLRVVTTALKIVTDLERIGDQSADIAELMMEIEGVQIYRTIEHIPLMAKKAKRMVHEAIDAFINRDNEKAKEIVKMDDDIDALFDEVKDDIIGVIKENQEEYNNALDYLMIAKYFERIGDHAVNICEWLDFLTTGSVNEQKII